jgi:hypothetical protein
MITVHINLSGVALLKKNDVKDAIRAAMQGMGVHWRRRFLPKHFTHAGAREYGYHPRAGEKGSHRKYYGSYTHQKLRKMNHTLPLVYSGEMRRQALFGLQKVRAIAHRDGEFTVKMRMPNKANYKNSHSRIHPIQELRKVSGMEIVALERFLERQVETNLRLAGATKGQAGVNIIDSEAN